MTTTMSIIGIFVGMFLLILLVYKGMSNIYVAPVCAVLVALFNGMPLLDTFLQTYLGGISGWMKVGFAFAVVGALFGKIYDVTGAAESVGRTLLGKLGNSSNKSKMVLLGLITMNVMQALLTWTGISGIVVVLASFPVAVSIARTINIPRKYIPGMIMSAGATSAMAAPGSPSIGNLTASSLLGTKATASLLPGLIGAMVVMVLGIYYMHRIICKDIGRGEGFVEIDGKAQSALDRVLPNFWISVIPLVIVFATFTILGLNVIICLTAGVIASLLLLSKYIPNYNVKNVLKMLNDGIGYGTLVYFQVASLMGFAAVVQATCGFKYFMNFFVHGLPGNSLTTATIAVVMFTLFTSSPPAALSLGISAFLPLVKAGSLPAAALHRTAVFATTTFESMPYCGAAILAMQVSGVTHKEGYPPVFVCTVLNPLIATGVVTLVLVFFPGLA